MSQSEQQVNPSLEELIQSTKEYTNRLAQIRIEKQAEENEPEKELMLWTTVAGLRFYLDYKKEDDRAFLDSLTPGTELLLKRDPDNEYDRWAIEVQTLDGRLIGYVTRYKNETIARMMDHGHIFEARVESQSDLAENLEEDQMAPTELKSLPFTIWLIKGGKADDK